MRRTGGEVRLALTWRCNFRCSFCHLEGQGCGRLPAGSARKALDRLASEIEQGRSDITLTGGEPLLERQRLREIIRGLPECSPFLPALTIVTNGTLWDDEMIELIASYPGPRKVNVSLHSADPATYDRITGTQGQLERVAQSIRNLLSAAVPVKLNAVVLRGINSGMEDRSRLVALARDLGVTAVKFLELLVMDPHSPEATLFVSSAEIEQSLTTLGYRRSGITSRGVVLTQERVSGFNVEVKRCSFTPGSRNYGPDLKPFPCFQANSSLEVGGTCPGELEKREVA